MAGEIDPKSPQGSAAMAAELEALKVAAREERERREEAEEKAKKAAEEAQAQRKARRQAEEAAEREKEQRARDLQKTLEEQGRFKDLYESGRRDLEQVRNEKGELEKRLAVATQEKDSFAAVVGRFEKARADQVEARFARLPEDTRKVYADRPIEVKEALAEMFERGAGAPRSPGTAGLIPPPGLGSTGANGFIYTEDLADLPQKAREQFFASEDFKRAAKEGRVVSRAKQSPR